MAEEEAARAFVDLQADGRVSGAAAVSWVAGHPRFAALSRPARAKAWSVADSNDNGTPVAQKRMPPSTGGNPGHCQRPSSHNEHNKDNDNPVPQKRKTPSMGGNSGQIQFLKACTGVSRVRFPATFLVV